MIWEKFLKRFTALVAWRTLASAEVAVGGLA